MGEWGEKTSGDLTFDPNVFPAAGKLGQLGRQRQGEQGGEGGASATPTQLSDESVPCLCV